uniref:Uncharacterized protein n=1 Tax=Pseudo-nitzschia australis TaxID=44445 RepID=A0A7S4ACT9_9STRA
MWRMSHLSAAVIKRMWQALLIRKMVLLKIDSPDVEKETSVRRRNQEDVASSSDSVDSPSEDSPDVEDEPSVRRHNQEDAASSSDSEDGPSEDDPSEDGPSEDSSSDSEDGPSIDSTSEDSPDVEDEPSVRRHNQEDAAS